MCRLNRVGQDTVKAALLLLTLLGIGWPAFAAPVGTPTLVNATEDDPPGSIDLTTVFSGGVAPESFSIVSNSDPSIVSASIGGNTLTLTYVPDASGTAIVTVQDTDSNVPADTATADITVNIAAVNDAPTADSQSVSASEDASLGITLTGSDPDGDGLSYTVGTPTSGTLTGTAPNLTYTPNANFNGSDSFTFTVNDGSVDSAAATVSVTVNAVNDPPFVAAIPAPTVVAEDSGTATVNLAGMFGDPDIATNGDTLTLSIVGTSNGALFAPAPSLSGATLSLPLAANQNGASTVTIRAQDAAGATVTGNVSVTVTPVNDAPTLTTPIPDQNMSEDSPPLVLALNTYFADLDIATNADTLTYSVTSNDNAAIVTTSITGQNLTLTVAPNANGVANISVQASDAAGATVSDSFKVTIDSVNDVPVAADDTAVMNEDGAPLDIDVLANDTHGDDPTTVVSAGATVTIGGVDYPNSSESTPTTIVDATGTNVTLPNGSLVINGNIVTYTPKQNFNGTDHFTYTIQDADGETATATVTITVNPVNDAPVQASTVSYTMLQASVLDILAQGGIASHGWDADSDTITVIQDTAPASLGMGYPGTTLGVSPDGAFLYTPDVNFVGTDTFVIRLYDGVVASAPVTVTVNVTAAPPPPPPPPPGEVEFDFNLAKVPLEDAVSSEANVLVIMDDSGSMDWALMTDGAEGEFWLTNAGIKDKKVGTATTDYQYMVPLSTNVYGNQHVMPTEEALNADPAFATNNYGAWRAWNAQYNTVYYNPAVQYKPWVGLNRNNVDFPNVSATAAPLDPYDAVVQTIDLTTPITYISNNVPIVKGNSGSRKNLSNNNVYLPRYYTTTATGRPAWNDPHTLVEIRNNGTTYAGGPNRSDCAVDDGDPATCTYAQEIQNFANWFSYYRSREYTAKAALGRTVADVSNIRLGYVVLNDANERLQVASMNSSYRVGNKKAMMNQIYKIDSNERHAVARGAGQGRQILRMPQGRLIWQFDESITGQCDLSGVAVARRSMSEQLRAAVLGRHLERVVLDGQPRCGEQQRRQRRPRHAVRWRQVRRQHRGYARGRRDVLLRARPAAGTRGRRADDRTRHAGCADERVQQQRRADASAHEDVHGRSRSRRSDRQVDDPGRLHDGVRMGRSIQRRPRESGRHAARRRERPRRLPEGERSSDAVAGTAERIPGIHERLGVGQRGCVQLDGAARADGGVPRFLQPEIQLG